MSASTSTGRDTAMRGALERAIARCGIVNRSGARTSTRVMAVSGRGYVPARADAMDGLEVLATGAASDAATMDAIVFGVCEEDVNAETSAIESEALRAFDARSGGAVSEMMAEGEFKGKAGSSAFSRARGGNAKHVGVVGLGKREERGVSVMMALGSTAAAHAQKSKCATLGIAGAAGFENAVAAGAYLGATDDQRFKSKPQAKTLKTVSLLDVTADVSAGKARAVGVQLTKELVAAPPNVVTPTALAETAKAIAAKHSDCMSVKILEKADCEKLGMGSYLGVSEASDEPPKFIHLTYKGAGSDLKKVAVVGKGLTFDSGGYNLKAGAGSMIEMMKYVTTNDPACAKTVRRAQRRDHDD
jgi:leucyl aminopeptidase